MAIKSENQRFIEKMINNVNVECLEFQVGKQVVAF